MSKYDYELIRRAACPWVCDRCGGTIAKGKRYIDRGWRNDFKEWIHVRKHICCNPRPDGYPTPISLKDGTKEWFLGAVHDMQGRPVLLTHDWNNPGQYHFRFYAYDEFGNRMTAKNLSKS